MKPTKLFPRCRGLAAIALSFTALASGASAGDGQFRYDVYDSNANNAKRTTSNATLNLSAGEIRNWSKDHVRNPENSGRNDLVITVKGPFGVGKNTFWLVKDGSSTLSFPPYSQGADLSVIEVKCLDVATIEDSRMLWNALGGGPTKLLKKMEGAARNGAEAALEAIAQSTQTALAGLDQGKLEAQRALLLELQTRAGQLSEGTSDVLDQLDAFVAKDFPELHEALNASADYASGPNPARQGLAALLAALREPAGFDPSRFGALELPCELNVEVVTRFELSTKELQSEIGAALGGGELVPVELVQLVQELDAICQCASGAARVSRAMRADLAALTTYLERVSGELSELDTRVLGRSGSGVQRRVQALVSQSAKLKGEVDTLYRLQQSVDEAEADFETSYAKIRGKSSPYDTFFELAKGALPSIPLPSFDREKAQEDLEVHAQATERYAKAIEKRDAQWDVVGRSAQRWAQGAGALASSLGKLRVDARGFGELVKTLGSTPRFRGPDRAARAASDCVAGAQRIAAAALNLLEGMTRKAVDVVLPRELEPHTTAVLGALTELADRGPANAQALARMAKSRTEAEAATLRLAALVAKPASGEQYLADVERAAGGVSRKTRAAAAAQAEFDGELRATRKARARLIQKVQALSDGLSRLSGKRGATLARIASAARDVVQIELEVRGLGESVGACTTALQEFVHRIDAVRAALGTPSPRPNADVATLQALLSKLQQLDEVRQRFGQALAKSKDSSSKKAADFKALVTSFLTDRVADQRTETYALYRAVRDALHALEACESAGVFAPGTPRHAPSQRVAASRSGRQQRRGAGPVSFPDVARTPAPPIEVPIPYPNIDGAGLRDELEMLNRLARLWIGAFEQTPRRLAKKVDELSPVSATARAEVEAQLANLLGFFSSLDTCAEQAWKKRAALTSPGRVDKAIAQVAKLPSGTAAIINDLKGLLSPASGWSFSAIAKKIQKGRGLLNKLNGMGAAARTNLEQNAATELAAFDSSAQCALGALGQFTQQATTLDAKLKSIEDASKAGGTMKKQPAMARLRKR